MKRASDARSGWRQTIRIGKLDSGQAFHWRLRHQPIQQRAHADNQLVGENRRVEKESPTQLCFRPGSDPISRTGLIRIQTRS